MIDLKDAEIQDKAMRLEHFGYVFRVTAREYSVIYKPQKDRSPLRLQGAESVCAVQLFDYDDAGDTGGEGNISLARRNLLLAIAEAERHLTTRASSRA